MCNKIIGYCDGSCDEAKSYYKELAEWEELAKQWENEEKND